MDMSDKCSARRRGSREEKSGTLRDEHKKFRSEESSSILMTNGDIFMSKLSSPHIMASQEIHSPQMYTEEHAARRRSSSRTSSSSSPAPLNYHHTNNSGGSNQQQRRNSDALTESIMSSHCHNNGNGGSFSSPGAIPLTKNVGVSVNLGKPNVKSNSSSAAGAQHITPNGHQHQPQQHTPGVTSSMAVSTVNNTNSHNSNNNNAGNSAAINLGHGHIGTITGPPSVSISSGLGLVSMSPTSSSTGVNHNSSLSTSPAANAPTTCANKGVPSSHNQQQQHLPISSPTTNHPRMSPHSPNLPIMNQPKRSKISNLSGVNGLPEESLQSGAPATPTVADSGKNGNSSSASSSSRNGGNGNNKNNSGVQTGPNSPSASSTTSSSSCSGGSKGETQPNVPKVKPNGSNGSDGSSNTNTNRIVSQNVNGTLAVTGVPSNECELQLFRVLQRANLLSYFDVMIELGGDDVQQLCDAGEEEFLEIMALIGMASKPLHVRRLQKALQEWITQPNLFQAPVLPPVYLGGNGEGGNINDSPLHTLPQLVTAAGVGQIPTSHIPYPTIPGHGTASGVPAFYTGVPTVLPGVPDPKGSPYILSASNQTNCTGINQTTNDAINNSGNHFAAAFQQVNALNPQLATLLDSFSPNLIANQQQQNRHSQSNNHSAQNNKNRSSSSRGKEKSTAGLVPLPTTMTDIKIPVDQLIPSHFLETRIRTSSEISSPASSIAGSPHPDGRNSISPVPVALQEHEVQKLADAAVHLIRSLPSSVAEPKLSTKRKTSADYEHILRLSDSDPRKLMEEVRRVAAVYGRPDAKRKTLKPLSMHEVAINEAAAQLCRHIPALLTKREELLSLSRQVLRESGLPYAAVSSTFSIPVLANGFVNTAAVSNIGIINNNDVNTKSKYEDLNRNHHHQKIRDNTEGNSGSAFSNFHAKRFRLDGSSGLEIQEYNDSRSPSIQNSPSPPSISNNGMQITELRCLPPRRSPSDDNVSSPLELVTVTSSDFRKNGITTCASKSSSASSVNSSSPPIRRPYSVEPDDLSNSSNNFHNLYGLRVGHQQLPNAPQSAKMTSIPVSGGSISILNHNGNGGSNHHFISQHIHHQYNGGAHSGMKFMPIKSEPTLN